jgi:GNAT superfamily N-acetyltransferase
MKRGWRVPSPGAGDANPRRRAFHGSPKPTRRSCVTSNSAAHFGRFTLGDLQPRTFLLALSDPPAPEPKLDAAAALYRHNAERTGIADRQPIAAIVSDAATGTVLGGLWGRTELGLLFLEMFFVPKALRGQDVGGALLALVESAAIQRGCARAVVETSTFQAPNFYLRHGYQEFGRVPFTAPGHARVFLQKCLA